LVAKSRAIDADRKLRKAQSHAVRSGIKEKKEQTLTGTLEKREATLSGLVSGIH